MDAPGPPSDMQEAARDGHGDGKQEKKKDQEKQPQPPKPPPRWPWFVGGLVILIFVVAMLWITLVPNADVWTDDAYVTAHYATVAPRVSGQVASVDVNDNQVVAAGQILVTLDDRDYRTTLARAEAQLAADSATIAQTDADVRRQPAIIDQADAQVASIQARLDLSRTDARRYANLASTGAGTAQQGQQANVTLRQDEASLRGAQAQLAAAQRQLEALRAQRDAAQARLASDQAQLDQARLDLSYTRIVAPLDGMVGQRAVQVGNYVAPGATMMAIVPLDRVYIEANYRELALRHMRPGQRVRIHVDAYDVDLEGAVDSVPPASGAAFSPIPANNATGNFTKIVQRLPVKIVLAPDQPLARLLRVGLSVECTVHTALADVVDAQRDAPGRVTAH